MKGNGRKVFTGDLVEDDPDVRETQLKMTQMFVWLWLEVSGHSQMI